MLFNPAVRFLAALALVALAAVGCARVQRGEGTGLTDSERRLHVESFDAAWETIRDRHWDADLGGMDWEAVRIELRPRVEQAQSKADYHDAMNSMIGRFDQSHFSVIPANVYEQLGGESGEESAEGTTGIELRVIAGRALVVKVDEGSPAERASVRTGWEIVRVDGKKTSRRIRRAEGAFEGKTMLDLVRHRSVAGMLTGKPGATKRISFRTGWARSRTLEIELAEPKGRMYRLGIFPAAHVWLESRRLEGEIGYIAFNAFFDPVAVMPAFEKAIKSFADCRGLIIDVRGNGGGMPGVAMGMAGWLIDSREEYFGTMQMRDAELRFVVNPRRQTFGGPIAVLIDGSSASCAEIFPAGLRDMGRARLFGTRTAGAVLPAHFMKLPNGDFFYYPIADYYSKGGERLEGVGVAPDVAAPHDRKALRAGRDNALEAAIEWIEEESSAPEEASTSL